MTKEKTNDEVKISKGNFVKTDDVKVVKRFRKDFGAMDELAVSIQKFGLLHPICVMKDDLELIAGERRLRAHKSLGLRKIEVKFFEDLPELERKEIEIEENLQRKSFTWPEEVLAKLALDQLKRIRYGSSVKGHKTDGGWRQKDTAAALGVSVGTISGDIKLAEALIIYPELMKEKTKTSAIKKFGRLRERDLQVELAKKHLYQALPFVYLGDNIAVMKKEIKENSVDLIVTDPQFGIGLTAQTVMKSFSVTYKQDDTEYRVFDQLDLALGEMHRVLKEHCHLYIFYAAKFYKEIRTLLEKNFVVNPTPIIWNKEQHSNPGGSKVYASAYEPCFLCSKGDPKELNTWRTNVQSIKGVPGNKRIHPTEKPTQLLRVFIEASSLPGDTVLDPYAGSGATGEAAMEMGRKAIVIDIDERYYTGMLERLGTKEKKDEKVVQGNTKKVVES